jgi:UDP-glucose 4-epimerase
MNILITGTAGRVGRAIHVRLSPFHTVFGIDKSPASTVDIVGDIRNEAILSEACKGVDAIIHTAALHAPHVGIVPDAEFERVNVEATQSLINTALLSGVPRIVFTSTTALYGSASRLQNKAAWIDETTEPQPMSIYHRTKLAAEALFHAASEERGVTTRIIRMSRCFPEAAPEMAWYRLSRGVDARDVAEAHALALVNDGAKAQTYIVSGATPFLPEDAEELFVNAHGVLSRRAPELVRAFADRGWALPTTIDRVYDSAKAQRELGWKPRYGYKDVVFLLDQGLSEVLPTKKLPTKKLPIKDSPIQ